MSQRARQNLEVISTVDVFVCAWCAEATPEAAASESLEVKGAANFGICDSCLEERLQVLDRAPVRAVRTPERVTRRLASRPT